MRMNALLNATENITGYKCNLLWSQDAHGLYIQNNYLLIKVYQQNKNISRRYFGTHDTWLENGWMKIRGSVYS